MCAWGETTSKTSFFTSNYAYYNSSTTAYTDLGSDISGTEFDAATVNMGKDWRMPTYAEMNELCNSCTWTWIQIDGVNGYKVEASNGNSIFLPAAGEKAYNGGQGKFLYYWTATSSKTNDAQNLLASADVYGLNYLGSTSLRHKGLSIRPVYSPTSDYDISNITDYVTVTRTGTSTVVTGSGIYYQVTFEIKNSSTELIHLSTLGGVDISNDLEGGKTHSVTLQSASSAIQSYKLTLVFTYNGKSYEVQG